MPVPASLQALEQKMTQIHFNTARIGERFALGQLGSPAGGSELASNVNSSSGFVVAVTGVLSVSPPMAEFTGRVEGLGSLGKTLHLDQTSREREIGGKSYTYEPSVKSYDGGRTWILHTRKPAKKQKREQCESGFSAVTDALGSALGGGKYGSSGGLFSRLAEDINGAISVQEAGAATIYAQQTTEFTALLSLEKLLVGSVSSKQLEQLKRTKGFGSETVELEVFITASGLPVRATLIVGGRTEGVGIEQDIQALEVPVAVHAPPAALTIGEARLNRLRARHEKKELAKHHIHLGKSPSSSSKCTNEGSDDGDGTFGSPTSFM